MCSWTKCWVWSATMDSATLLLLAWFRIITSAHHLVVVALISRRCISSMTSLDCSWYNSCCCGSLFFCGRYMVHRRVYYSRCCSGNRLGIFVMVTGWRGQWIWWSRHIHFMVHFWVWQGVLMVHVFSHNCNGFHSPIPLGRTRQNFQFALLLCRHMKDFWMILDLPIPKANPIKAPSFRACMLLPKFAVLSVWEEWNW